MSLLSFKHDWGPDVTDVVLFAGYGEALVHWEGEHSARVSVDIEEPGVEGWLRHGGSCALPFSVLTELRGLRVARVEDRAEPWVYGRGEDEFAEPPAILVALMSRAVAESAELRPWFRLVAAAKQADKLRRLADESAAAAAGVAERARGLAVAAWAQAVDRGGGVERLGAPVPADLWADVVARSDAAPSRTGVAR